MLIAEFHYYGRQFLEAIHIYNVLVSFGYSDYWQRLISGMMQSVQTKIAALRKIASLLLEIHQPRLAIRLLLKALEYA